MLPRVKPLLKELFRANPGPLEHQILAGLGGVLMPGKAAVVVEGHGAGAILIDGFLVFFLIGSLDQLIY